MNTVFSNLYEKYPDNTKHYHILIHSSRQTPLRQNKMEIRSHAAVLTTSENTVVLNIFDFHAPLTIGVSPKNPKQNLKWNYMQQSNQCMAVCLLARILVACRFNLGSSIVWKTF